MTLSILSLAARGGEDIAVTFEIRSGEHTQKETFLIPAPLIADLRLTCGEVDRACYDAVSHGAEVHTARKRGLYILGYGGCSERALCRKLVMKGIKKEIAEEAISELRRLGYLDPSADAFREAERCVAKLWGARRIVATLLAKGYSREAARDAINGLEDAGVDYADLCAERIRKQAGGLPSEPDRRRKLIAALERYGFSRDEIREAFRLVSEERDDPT